MPLLFNLGKLSPFVCINEVGPVGTAEGALSLEIMVGRTRLGSIRLGLWLVNVGNKKRKGARTAVVWWIE